MDLICEDQNNNGQIWPLFTVSELYIDMEQSSTMQPIIKYKRCSKSIYFLFQIK